MNPAIGLFPLLLLPLAALMALAVAVLWVLSGSLLKDFRLPHGRAAVATIVSLEVSLAVIAGLSITGRV